MHGRSGAIDGNHHHMLTPARCSRTLRRYLPVKFLWTHAFRSIGREINEILQVQYCTVRYDLHCFFDFANVTVHPCTAPGAVFFIHYSNRCEACTRILYVSFTVLYCTGEDPLKWDKVPLARDVQIINKNQ